MSEVRFTQYTCDVCGRQHTDDRGILQFHGELRCANKIIIDTSSENILHFCNAECFVKFISNAFIKKHVM